MLITLKIVTLFQVIDDLHLKNHKDEKCRQKYAPSEVKEKDIEQGMNFMSAEQVFAWLSRFKRIIYYVQCLRTITSFIRISLLKSEISTLSCYTL
jgi:hypothetical protein